MADTTKRGDMFVSFPILDHSPEKLPKLVRKRLWTFLRGIEGFDNTRAGQCLVRLLETHYETISVLKLATKQDLVEDAGILPGDALRIVSAAKAAVIANRDVDLHPELAQYASKPGGVIPIVTLSVLGSESRKRASISPTQQACIPQPQPAAYVPPAPREMSPVRSPQPARSESPQPADISPVRPEKKAKIVIQETSKSERQDEVRNEVAGVQEVIKEANEGHACGICNVMCDSEQDMRSHFTGLMHAHNLGLAKEKGDNSRTTFTHCSICHVSCTSKKNLVMHFNGKKHKSQCK